MSESTRTALKILGMLIVGYIAWKIVVALTFMALKIAVPVLVLGGIAYVVYQASNGKSLTGGRKTLP
jgi:hypothetical protein